MIPTNESSGVASRTPPSHPSTHSPRGTITKLPLTSPGGWLCVLPLGLPTTGIQTSVTVIILDCNWESPQKRLLLLGLNSCFLPASNLPYPLNSVSLTSSLGFLHRPVILREGPHGERSLSPKPNKRTFLEGRDHGLTLFESFPDSRPVSNICWVLDRNLLQHLTGKQESSNWGSKVSWPLRGSLSIREETCKHIKGGAGLHCTGLTCSKYSIFLKGGH